MTRKSAARGRKEAAGRSGRATSRAASRTGRKTASARAAHPAPRKPAERKGAPARRAAVRAPEPVVEEREPDQLPGSRAEEDEDFDWLAEEDEVPRSQIVEDDDEWERNHEEEW